MLGWMVDAKAEEKLLELTKEREKYSGCSRKDRTGQLRLVQLTTAASTSCSPHTHALSHTLLPPRAPFVLRNPYFPPTLPTHPLPHTHTYCRTLAHATLASTPHPMSTPARFTPTTVPISSPVLPHRRVPSPVPPCRCPVSLPCVMPRSTPRSTHDGIPSWSRQKHARVFKLLSLDRVNRRRRRRCSGGARAVLILFLHLIPPLFHRHDIFSNLSSFCFARCEGTGSRCIVGSRPFTSSSSSWPRPPWPSPPSS